MSITFPDKPADVASSKLDYEGLNARTSVSKQKNYFLKILLEPFKLNASLTLKNRCIMAPMTRCFANNGEPTECMAEYYGKRNGFGLIWVNRYASFAICFDKKGDKDIYFSVTWHKS